MSKVAFTTVLDREDAALSEHFGAARWLVIHDDESGETNVEPSAGSDGRAIASMLAISDCTDVVCAEIGPVALAILRMIEVRAWQAPLGIPASELLAAFRRGDLPRATPVLRVRSRSPMLPRANRCVPAVAAATPKTPSVLRSRITEQDRASAIAGPALRWARDALYTYQFPKADNTSSIICYHLLPGCRRS